MYARVFIQDETTEGEGERTRRCWGSKLSAGNDCRYRRLVTSNYAG
jgi:hypothetical protein